MWIVIPIAVGSVLLVVAGFTWAARREVLERARRVRSLAPTPLDEVKGKQLVAVRGTAAAEDPVQDPVLGESVAFFEARLTKNGAEVRTLREGNVIAIEDANARAEVRLESAELDLAWDDVEESDGMSAKMRAVFSTNVPSPNAPEAEQGAKYTLSHRAIRIGDPLTVVGTPRFDERGSTRDGYRGGAGTLPRFDAKLGVLIVSASDLAQIQHRELGDSRAMSTMLRLSVAIGAALVGIGAIMLAMA
jgi:hypothetical protein